MLVRPIAPTHAASERPRADEPPGAAPVPCSRARPPQRRQSPLVPQLYEPQVIPEAEQGVREPQSQFPSVVRLVAPGQCLQQVVQLRFQPSQPFPLLAPRELGLGFLRESHVILEMAEAPRIPF